MLSSRAEHHAQAWVSLKRALARRPNLSAAWFQLGQVEARMGRLEDAAESLERALEIRPSHSRAYVALAETLLELADRQGALRSLRHGVEAAREADPVLEALSRLEVTGATGTAGSGTERDPHPPPR